MKSFEWLINNVLWLELKDLISSDVDGAWDRENRYDSLNFSLGVCESTMMENMQGILPLTWLWWLEIGELKVWFDWS